MKYSIKTKGMGCPHCVKRVTKAMETLGADIKKVELNDIEICSELPEAAIREAIEKLGFEVTEIRAEQ